MKKVASFVMFVLFAVSVGTAAEPAAANRTAAEDPKGAEGTPAQDVGQVSPLEELDWMVGTWVDKGEDVTITTTCSWMKNRKFLTRSFTMEAEGEPSLEGKQMIGWDPISSHIRSWTFDSEGGYGEGRWIRDGNRWLVKKSFVLATGERASAVNVITYVDRDTLRWESTHREVGGELLPNIPEVTVVRERPKKAKSEGKESEVSK